MWYFYNYAKDQQEDFENKRDFIEYHASFIEPQAVRKIIDARENTISVSDDDFSNNIKKMFGRDVVMERPKGADNKIQTASATQIMQNLKSVEQQPSGNKMMESDFWKDLE